MTNYVVIKKSAKISEQLGNRLYGICACSFAGGVLEIQNCVYDVSDDLAWLKALSDKLNRCDVDPIHLRDIIDDELYDLRV